MLSLLNLERVLVPIDFSDAAFEALTAAIHSIEELSHLHVLHVLSHLNPGDPGASWQTVNTATRRRHVEKAFSDRISKDIADQINLTVLVGNPSAAIIDYAKSHDISLIVMPSHGRTGLERFMIGSVTERVVRRASCPVLVLRR
jgi:nucleotide-binding universal stress UspA family protein